MVQVTENPAMKETDPRLEKFERFENEAKHPSWVFPLRKAGLARFAEMGFPSLQDEDWRATNVAPIARLPFKPVFEAAGNGLGHQALSQFVFGSVACSRLVFVNGHYAADLSSPGPQEAGLVIGSLAEALARDSSLLETHLGRYATGEDNPFR